MCNKQQFHCSCFHSSNLHNHHNSGLNDDPHNLQELIQKIDAFSSEISTIKIELSQLKNALESTYTNKDTANNIGPIGSVPQSVPIRASASSNVSIASIDEFVPSPVADHLNSFVLTTQPH